MEILLNVLTDSLFLIILSMLIVGGVSIIKSENYYKKLLSTSAKAEKTGIVFFTLSILLQMRIYDMYLEPNVLINIKDSWLFISLAVNFIVLCYFFRDNSDRSIRGKLIVISIAMYQVGLAFAITTLPIIALHTKILSFIVGIQLPALCVYTMDELQRMKYQP